MGLEFEGWSWQRLYLEKKLNLVEEEYHKPWGHKRWHNPLKWGSSS